MEKPYQGRAVLTDTLQGLEISIPAKRNFFVSVFLGVWLTGWLAGEVAAVGAISGMMGEIGGVWPVTIWLVVWSMGGIMALRVFLWMTFGKENVIFGRNEIVIKKSGLLLAQPQSYALKDVKNFRVFSAMPTRRKSTPPLARNGTICFDYGFKTIRFGDSLDENEAGFIISKLIEKRILSEHHISYSSAQVTA